MPICVLQHIIYRNMLYITLPWRVDSAWKDSITSNAFCYIVGSDGFCQADHCSLWCWVCTTKWNSFWRGTQRYLQIIYNSYSAQNSIWDIKKKYYMIYVILFQWNCSINDLNYSLNRQHKLTWEKYLGILVLNLA